MNIKNSLPAGRQGFSLVELLVVISIIGILSTLVVANLNSARERARDAQRKSDLRNIQTALRLYYNDVGRYPAASSGRISGCGGACEWDAAWVNNGVTYMNVLPGDPLSTQDYNYTYVDTENYTLRACLENKSDEKGVTATSSECASLWKYEVKP
jgi:type II secretion system protein G